MINLPKLETEVLQTIGKTDETALVDENFENDLLEKFLQPPLKYVKEKSNKIAGTELLPKTDDLEQSFPTQPFAYIEFQFAVEGNYMHKDDVFDEAFLIANHLYFDTIDTNVYLVYKEFNKPPIEEESIFLDRVNEAGTVKRTLMEQRIALFNEEVERVNASLKTFIHANIEDARLVVKKKKESLDQLDPF